MSLTIADPLVGQIQEALPRFLINRRWYRAKARTISSTGVVDVITANGFLILLVAVNYVDGERDIYLLPVTSSAHPGGVR